MTSFRMQSIVSYQREKERRYATTGMTSAGNIPIRVSETNIFRQRNAILKSTAAIRKTKKQAKAPTYYC